MTRPVLLLALTSAFASAAGMLRELTTAYFFGTSAASDAFALTLFYVDGLTSVMMLGLAGYVLVPVVTGLEAKRQPDEAFRLMETILLWTLCVGVPATVFVVVRPDTVANFLAPRFSPAQHQDLAGLLRCGGPAILCLLLSSVIAGVLQGKAHYYPASCGRAAFNVTVTVILAGFSGLIGILAGGAGLLIGSFVLLAVQLFAVRSHGWVPRRPRWSHANLRGASLFAVPALLAFALSNVVMGGAQRAFASGLAEGGLAAVNYAERTVNLVALVTLAFSTVSLTELSSEFHVTGLGSAAKARLRNTIESSAFFVLPFACLLFILSEPVTRLLFHRGRYGDDALQLTSSCLEWLTIGLLPGLVLSILHRAFPAFGRPWRATWTSVIWAASTVFATIVLMPGLGARALPAGFTIGITVGCVASCVLLTDLVGWQFFVIVARSLGRLALLSVLPAVLAWSAVNRVASFLALVTISDVVCPLIVVTVATSVFCMCYVALCILSRHPQMTRLVDLVQNRLRPTPLSHVI